MTVVACPVVGTYLVRDETQPIPLGKTPTDVSVVVHRYRFGWVCTEDGYTGDTSRGACRHIWSAQKAAN